MWCEGLEKEWKLLGQGTLGMSDDPSPSSFPVHGVTANLLPAGAPASGPEMRVQYLKLHLLATCVLTLWLKVFLLDQKSSQNDLRKMPRNSSKTCECPQNSLRKCICSSEVHEYSTCLGIPGEPVWLDEHFEMDVEPLIRSEVPMSSDVLLLWLVSAHSWSLSSPRPQSQAPAISPSMAPGSTFYRWWEPGKSPYISPSCIPMNFRAWSQRSLGIRISSHLKGLLHTH